jgi:hypothetical protein
MYDFSLGISEIPTNLAGIFMFLILLGAYVMGSHSYVVHIQSICTDGEVLHTDPDIDWYERIK